jgi:NADH-quinone oxidoreductase subunit A
MNAVCPPMAARSPTSASITYFYAIVFLAFEVDILYLFPVSTWFTHSVGFAPVWKILVFLFVLGLAVVYFQRKGVFEWPRRIQISPRR